jgi:hypothetical protein
MGIIFLTPAFSYKTPLSGGSPPTKAYLLLAFLDIFSVVHLFNACDNLLLCGKNGQIDHPQADVN